jgi:hypothetical protein
MYPNNTLSIKVIESNPTNDSLTGASKDSNITPTTEVSSTNDDYLSWNCLFLLILRIILLPFAIGLVILIITPILAPIVWFSAVVLGMICSPLGFFLSTLFAGGGKGCCCHCCVVCCASNATSFKAFYFWTMWNASCGTCTGADPSVCCCDGIFVGHAPNDYGCLLDNNGWVEANSCCPQPQTLPIYSCKACCCNGCN